MAKLICITGGGSVGKTTTMNLLASRDFLVVREAATDIIQEGKFHPVDDFEEFQREIYLTQVEREIFTLREAMGELVGYCDHNEPIRAGWHDFVFCDRGIYDTFAYCEMHGKPRPDYILGGTLGPRYPEVFLLEPLDHWEDNGIRYEDLEFTKTITPILERIYREVGSRVVRVPNLQPEARVEFILSSLVDTLDA